MSLPLFKQEYWYITFLHEGRPVVWRIENVHTEAEAVRKGSEKLSGKLFRVFCLKTKNEAEATKHARALLLDGSNDVGSVLRRARHQDFDPRESNEEDMQQNNNIGL